jgi:beta-glucosidase
MKKIVFTSLLLLYILSLPAQVLPYLDTSLSFEQRAADLVSRLTLEEKASLMVHESKAIDRLGIPSYNWWNEALHGVARNGKATVFPQAIGMAATFDDSLIHKVASTISDEARAKHHAALKLNNRSRYSGLTFWTPNVNIFRDPRWGRGHETYGEDPHLTAQMGVAFVKGLQGNDPKYLKTAACAKHYVVHSGPEPLRHKFNAKSSDRDFRETYLPAFKALVDAGVEAVMCAYNRTNDEACCGSHYLLNDVLRQELGFKGHIVSDCWALVDIWKHHKIVSTTDSAAALSMKSGVNLNCGVVYKNIPSAVRNGLVSENEVDQLLKKLLVSRFKLGMFDDACMLPYSNLKPEIVNCQEHKELARKVAAKSMVLLKNKNNVLPLRKDLSKLFVTGPVSTSIEALLANYHGVSGEYVTFLEGIVNKVSVGTSVEYRKGTDMLMSKFNGMNLAASAPTIACIGITSEFEGEQGDAMLSDFNGDRKRIRLPENQIKFIHKLRKAAKDNPLIVVLSGGSAIPIPEIDSIADAVIYTWYPGEQGGNALADVIFGDHNPAGRLPLTFYRAADDLPDYENYDMTGRTYRFFEGKPLYEFGFGLSYTNFEYSNIKTDKPQYKQKDTIHVSVNVKNSGDFDGEEVIQLYVKNIDSNLEMPVKSLKGFKRADIPKETTTSIRFELPAKELAYWNEEKYEWEVEKGVYEIQVGASSSDIRLKKRITIH